MTDVSIRALKPPQKGQVTFLDKSLSGFGVRVSQGGTKTFTVVYGANRRRASLGKYGVISLSDARKEAKRILAEHTLGKTRPRTINFQNAVDLYLAACEQKNRSRTVYDYKRLLERHFRLGRTNLADITKHDISGRLNQLKGTPSEQNYAFVAARAFFRWAVQNDYLEHSPIEGLKMPARTSSRDRVLSNVELDAVYKHALAYSYPYGPIVALLALTGQRRGEIAALEWDWIDQNARTITLPDTLTKNLRTHTFPYGIAVESVLKNIPDTGKILFPARSRGIRRTDGACFNGWSKAKKLFDAELDTVGPYVLHDLRRTFSSNLAAFGTPIHVTEKLLNHATGTLSGVAAIYNRHSYMDEMRNAIEKYEAQFIGFE